MMQQMISVAVLAATSATFAQAIECAPAKLTADDGANSDRFGLSVAASDGVAVIGAPFDDNDNHFNSGSAYVYVQSHGTWQQVAKLTANDGAESDFFGYSVATSGGVAVIGADGDNDNGSSSGSAYVYEQQADGTWEQIAKLTADDGAESDFFGYSVATAGGVAMIGAYRDDDNGLNSGSVYVFEQQADGTWQQVAKLTADDGAESDFFGGSVTIDGGVAVIGALGNVSSAYVFEQQADGTWQQVAKLTGDGNGGDEWFGQSVATSGGVAVIGAPYDADDGVDSGSAYVFEQQKDGTWQRIAKLTADDGDEGYRFGGSVAIDGDVAVIGAIGSGENGTDSGSTYVYELQEDDTWQQTAKLTADDGAKGDSFGHSVATSGGVAVIGAHGDDASSGSAYVYDLTWVDCNNNNICDSNELSGSPWLDSDESGVLDECEVGACCVNTAAACTISLEANCLRFGGQWQGRGTTCVEVDCLTPCISDLTGSGDVTIPDLLILLEHWGPCP